MAERFGVEYKAHDATEDARCAGEILLRAIHETGLPLERRMTRVNEPIDSALSRIERDGDREGEFAGEVLVFTGTLSMLRREAADAASAAGCRVDAGVTKHTTILVIGDQDIRKLDGHEKSSKHMKAENLIRNGQSIRIFGDSDFPRVMGNLSGCVSPIPHRAGRINS